MKKICIGLLAILISIPVLLLAPDSVSADTGTVIDRVHIEVDVPVDGVSLKSTAAVYEFMDSKNMEMINANTATEVVDIYWYKTTDPANVLSKGYKAKLGESYNVTVVIKAKDGYVLDADLYTKKNLVNGSAADTFSGTMANGDAVWLFDSTFTTIPAASGKPVIVIKEINLTPYEGNPMEIVLEVTNATNVKYQWQITYGDYDGSGWGGAVDLDDNKGYRGTKTNHFKIHSYFGDTFDEDLSFGKARCKVTSDNGTAYSQPVWYTLRDRQVVNGFTLTGLDTPVLGKKPDYILNSADSSKYDVKKVIWYGPKDSNGVSPEMKSNSTFVVGEYTCKIIVETTDAYKIDDSYYGKVNGTDYIINTIHGKDQPIYGPDTYYVNVPFKVTEIPLSQISASVAVPAAGNLPENAVSVTNGITATETNWSMMDDRGRYIDLKEGETFAADTTYRCMICMKLDEGYTFASSLKPYINGKEVSFSMLKGDDYRWLECRFRTEAIEVPDIPDNPFTDVSENDYFYKAVLWAVENKITAGLTDTTFGPEVTCTRAQAVTFIWRAAGKPEPTGDKTPFVDVKETDYYYKAVLWAVENKITVGTTDTLFSPDANCTRGQIVSFLWRAEGRPDTNGDNPFTDVNENDYFYEAVLWAVENKITAGLTPTIFGAGSPCTRGQIVSFLYRNAVN